MLISDCSSDVCSSDLVTYAIYSMKNERSASDIYGKLSSDEINTIIRQCAALPAGPAEIPTLHRQTPAQTRSRPLNLVLIVQESLGAQYVGNLGGAGLKIGRQSGRTRV